MSKQLLVLILLCSIGLFTSFTAVKTEKWTAVLELDGKEKKIILKSEAINGGYNADTKRVFLFGKNHMFKDIEDMANTKIFHDLCTTNASGQFEFEVNGLSNLNATIQPVIYSGNISFKKKQLKNVTFFKKKIGDQFFRVIKTNGTLNALGFTLTEEAQKAFTGQYYITFTSEIN